VIRTQRVGLLFRPPAMQTGRQSVNTRASPGANPVYSHCMRAILAGGGTGGHVIPALAIAQQLQKDYAAEVLFILPTNLNSS